MVEGACGTFPFSLVYNKRYPHCCATALPCLPLRREGDRDLLAVEGEILISYGVYANDRITTPPSPIRVPPPLTRGGKGSRVVGKNGVVPRGRSNPRFVANRRTNP